MFIPRPKAVCACLIGFALTLPWPHPATAAWPSDPTGNVPICTAPDNQAFSKCTSDGAGGAIVTWMDQRSGTHSQTFAQHVRADGAVDPTWPTDGTLLCDTPFGGYPAIVADGAGGAIVSWADYRNGANVDIYAQRVLSNGLIEPNWPSDGRPVCTAANVQGDVNAVTDGEHGAIIAWQDMRSDTSHIFVQHVMANGEIDSAWPTDGRAVCSVALNYQAHPAIVPDDAGGVLVAWDDLRGDVGYDIYTQHILATGVVDPAWPADGRPLFFANGADHTPAMASDGAGGAIVAWDGIGGEETDIYAQHVLAAGQIDPAWPTGGQVLCSAASDQSIPTIVTDDAGGAIVAWVDWRSGTQTDIFAQHVLASGAVDPAWPVDGRALCAAPHNQGDLAIVRDGVGGAVVAWDDFRHGYSDIYTQHVQAGGSIDPNWPADGRALCSAALDQWVPSIVPDGAGGAVVTWDDHRHPDWDVYAQRIDRYGLLGGVAPLDAPGEAARGLVLGQPRPNPSRGRTLMVSFALGGSTNASLELIDAAGRRILVREVGSLGAGSHTLDLGHGRSLAPGIYFVRLRQGRDVQVARAIVLN